MKSGDASRELCLMPVNILQGIIRYARDLKVYCWANRFLDFHKATLRPKSP